MSAFANSLRSLNLSTGKTVHYHSLRSLEEQGLINLAKLPMSVKILLESLLRMQPHAAYTEEHITNFCKWDPKASGSEEFPYMPSRVLLQDFTGVPCVVDLAALRSALQRSGGDPASIEPQIPVDLIIDHSVQVDEYRGAPSFDFNLNKEFERNRERYIFLRWGQGAFEKLRVLPPGLGICHQVNMEYLASCVGSGQDSEGRTVAFPDTLVGTDSHTTMINSMGVLGWGVGGIEAEAAMLGQPIPILTPKVVGCRLVGKIASGCTPTDLALKVTEVLRAKGVVGQFVEFFGPGLDHMTVSDRAPVANMSPEYGATMGLFPIDQATCDYLRMTGRDEEQIELVEAYCKEQGLWREPDHEPEFSDVVEIDLSTLQPALAGPKRPQDRVLAAELHKEFAAGMREVSGPKAFNAADKLDATGDAGEYGIINQGDLVIAAITSCTNTSNPTLLIGAGLVAKKAVERGLTVSNRIKTSLAPGSRVVTEYLKDTGLLPYLEKLGFYVVAYGCTTCIGNSGPLQPEIEKAIKDNNLITSAVLSGNRNFEGRVHPLTKANYLASPPLVVAYALKGTVAGDLMNDPIGNDQEGQPVYLKDLWPSMDEINELLITANNPETYKRLYADVVNSSPTWSALPDETSSVFAWESDSTYIREPNFFDGLTSDVPALQDVNDAEVLLSLGDFITTDHISPAGAIPSPSAAETYLEAHGVQKPDFNSFGSRRGNHEVMMRGTFANIRIRNKLVEREGGFTIHHPSGEETFVYDAAMKYKENGTPLVILAGKLYGAGSSRDWAAKGTFLLGVKAVIAETFERIHRSNLVEMGVLPLEFVDGQNADSLGLKGNECISISGITSMVPGKRVDVTATAKDGSVVEFQAKSRIDSAIEVDYYQHGGILQYVLRDVMSQTSNAV
jgi:aconitate hydratase